MEEQEAKKGTGKKTSEDKHRKRDPTAWVNIRKEIESLDEAGKLAYVEKIYQALYDESQKLKINNQQLVKQIVARGKLESLCRELQKQNKQIKMESAMKIKEAEELRKEVSLKLADKLRDINNMMDENKEKNEKLREENVKMTTKLSELYNQFQKREDTITQMAQLLEVEKQLSQATIGKLELELQAEREMHLREQTIYKNNMEKSEANCTVLMATVKGLQDQIEVYKKQYEDFDTTMSKSTIVVDNFKSQVTNMSRKVAELGQQAQSWKEKFQNTMKALVEMSELKKQEEMYRHGVEKKNERLEKLCRQIQVDRGNYLKLLKLNGIEAVSQPEVPVEGEKDKAEGTNTKMTKKEKQLQILKESLKDMQAELLTRLSAEEGEKNDKSDNKNGAEPEGEVATLVFLTGEGQSNETAESVAEHVNDAGEELAN